MFGVTLPTVWAVLLMVSTDKREKTTRNKNEISYMWQKGVDQVFVPSSPLTPGFDKSIPTTCENVALDQLLHKEKQTFDHQIETQKDKQGPSVGKSVANTFSFHSTPSISTVFWVKLVLSIFFLFYFYLYFTL